MDTIKHQVAEKLLNIKAIKLQPTNPFIWASGWESPIYCDNRKTLSYTDIRNYIKIQIARLILEKYDHVDAIAGVATGAIAQGAMVAEELGLPFVYVRSSRKDHGLENLIEGDLKPGMRVVVVEDLISTGGSSLAAVKAIENDNCEVVGMMAIFTYGFKVAVDAFKEAGVELTALSDYDTLIQVALETKYITKNSVDTLKKWRQDPSNWKPA